MPRDSLGGVEHHYGAVDGGQGEVGVLAHGLIRFVRLGGAHGHRSMTGTADPGIAADPVVDAAALQPSPAQCLLVLAALQ